MPGTTEQIKRVKASRNKLVADQRAIVAKAETENREIDSEEQSKLDQMQTQIEGLDSRVGTLETMLAAEQAEDDADTEANDNDKEPDGQDDDKRSKKVPGGKAAYKPGEVVVLADGTRLTVQGAVRANPGSGRPTVERRDGETNEQYASRQRRAKPEYVKAFVGFLLHGERSEAYRRGVESRAVIAGVDVEGGYLTAPEQFLEQVLKAADNYLWIRQLATKFTVSDAQSLGVPTLDTDVGDPTWTSELATGTLDESIRFGKRELRPTPLAQRIQIGNKFLQHGKISGVITAYDGAEGGTGSGAERFVTGRLGYKFGTVQEYAFLLGNGVGQPLGLFVASSRGINTDRDVTMDGTAVISFNGLMEAKYSLKAPYQANARWLWSRHALRRIRQLKDSYGRYLWQESVQAGEPDKILDSPVVMSEYVPAVFTTGSYVGMYGDFSYYWIAEGASMQIQVLKELYAEKNLTGYIARAEVDGMPALSEAFARIKLG